MDVGLWLAFFPAFKAIISILQIKWLKFIKSIYFANPLSENLTFSTVHEWRMDIPGATGEAPRVPSRYSARLWFFLWSCMVVRVGL